MKMFSQITWREVCLTSLGTLIVAFGTAVFILPFEFITGGVAGLSLVVFSFLRLPFLSLDLLVAIFSWGLFLLGLIFLGRKFAMKTLLSTIIYPIFISLFLRLGAGAFGGYFNLAESPLGESAALLAAVFGGVLIGSGCALTFKAGGSSGGIDILVFIICKFYPRIRSSTALFIIDAIIVLFGAFVSASLAITLLGISTALIASFVIDRLFLGTSRAFSANIISSKYEQINSQIISRMARTATIISARGGYSGEEKQMLLVTFSMREYALVQQIVKEIDPHAFIIFTRIHEINGEGWS